VDSREAGQGAIVAPGRNTMEVSVDEKRAANVTCAKGNTTFRETSADLAGVIYGKYIGVNIIADSCVVDGDDGLQEDVRVGAVENGRAPSRDEGFGADGGGSALRQKVDGGGVGVPGEGVRNLHFIKTVKELYVPFDRLVWILRVHFTCQRAISFSIVRVV